MQARCVNQRQKIMLGQGIPNINCIAIVFFFGFFLASITILLY